jgi:hypothetical protein
VLEDTLVIITSGESHGDDIADWVSSWGLAAISPQARKTCRASRPAATASSTSPPRSSIISGQAAGLDYRRSFSGLRRTAEMISQQQAALACQ